jgi:3-hydroxyisobutyrate dehydrogenase
LTDGIGIAGSGRVSAAFLARLRAGGIAVSGLAIPGCNDLSDPTAFAQGLRTLIAVPRDIGELETLLFSTQRLAETAPFLERIVIAATLSPRYVRALRGRIRSTIALIDAPYSGTAKSVEQGRLSFLVSGEEKAIDALQPVFGTLALRTLRMGGFGAATSAKVLNSLLTASSAALTRIALDWAEAQGIDEERIFDVTESTLGPALFTPGLDLIQNDHSGQGVDATIAALVESVELALDLAFSEAHLRPPRTMLTPHRGQRMRALH